MEHQKLSVPMQIVALSVAFAQMALAAGLFYACATHHLV